MHKSKTWRNV